MKRISFLVISSALMLLCSCQKTKVEVLPSPKEAITGDLACHFSMPDQTIAIDMEAAGGTFDVDLKCSTPLPSEVEISLGYDVLDENGNVLAYMKFADDAAESESIDQLRKAKKDDEVTVTFAIPEKDSDIKDAKYLRIKSRLDGSCYQVQPNDPDEDYVTTTAPHEPSVKKIERPQLKDVNLTHDYSDYVCFSLLTDDDLRSLSAEELRILRNTIFARHGRKFKSPELQAYFSGFSWYKPLYDEISESELSDIEKQNIILIRKYE